MSGRRPHHFHNSDYERYNGSKSRAIEYQDDSLSSINSDDETYLSVANKTRKHSNSTTGNSSKPGKSKEAADNTSERLGRLESMLEQLIKNSNKQVPTTSNVDKNEENSTQNRYQLEPRKYTFTTSMWLNHIQEKAIQNNWNEARTIEYMVSLMPGIIKAWYNKLNSKTYTWPEWKLVITKMFPDNVDFITTLKRLVTRFKLAEESLTNYYFSKMYLIEGCKISGADAVSCLIDGLNNQQIQEDAKAHNFLTPEMLYSQYLSSLPDYTVDYVPMQETEEEPIIVHEEIEQLEELEPPKRRKSSSPSKRAVHSRLDRRFIKPQYKNRMPLAAKICGICSNRGHSAYNCRSRNFYCSLPNQIDWECYYKKCFINNKRFDCFIDTGCTGVILKERVVKMLGLKIEQIEESKTCKVESYGGSIVSTLGSVNIEIKVDNVKVELEAVAVRDYVQEVDVMVGQAFLNQDNVGVLLISNQLVIFQTNSNNQT